MPVPVKAIVSGEPGALLVTDTLPLAAPAVVGANVTVKVVVCPAFRLAGADHPLSVNPVPEMECAEIETAEVPVFVNVTDTGAVEPTATLPKLSLAGLADSPPLAIPVPLSEIANGEFEASLVMVKVPVAAPVALGANWT